MWSVRLEGCVEGKEKGEGRDKRMTILLKERTQTQKSFGTLWECLNLLCFYINYLHLSRYTLSNSPIAGCPKS